MNDLFYFFSIYVAPHVNVLQRGVDFTFQDGRPIYVTSLDELRRKKEQIELGAMNEAEEMYKRQLETEKQKNERRLAVAPLPKGMQEIS
ncbi:unnamed protein product [Onchocerca flexuosa]|uniref:39S ribosomal protein L52, mitochondrial n=1 Tax=Onchocerca flexuosa TaxID=387005 RepID=A0A183H7K0_9BILA|nr:unnamed protein product [Onchocerca flexuosa]